ncbi:MAG TPA: hypothetical protein VGL99_07085 [Chloroflexota bacterium]
MPPDPGLTLSIAAISAVALVIAAVLGTRAAAKINAAASLEIARVNAENAREIEWIKADAAREAERAKEIREWRRSVVAPILEAIEVRTKRLLELADAVQLKAEPEVIRRLMVQLNADLAFAAAMPYMAGTTGRLRDALNRLKAAEVENYRILEDGLIAPKGSYTEETDQLARAAGATVGQAITDVMSAAEHYIYGDKA